MAPAPATRFDRLRDTAPVWLADGGLETQLIYGHGIALPEFAAYLTLYREGEREVLASIYRSYLDIAARSGLPMQVGTPTWRANRACLARQGFAAPGDVARVNADAVALLMDLRRAAGLEAQVVIAGVIGPQGDGYDPTYAPDCAAARAYHQEQADSLAAAGVDLLYAPTFPSVAEMEGVARAMAAAGLPYVLAPVIDPQGRLLDGSAFADAIARIDAAVAPPPAYFMVGCTHATRFRAAQDSSGGATSAGALGPRVMGLKANASAKPPEELVALTTLDAGEPEAFATDMMNLRRNYRLRVLGGCCGTDARHIAALADRLRANDAGAGAAAARP